MPDEKSKIRGAPFVVPGDVIRKLGSGDIVTGMAVLRDSFNLPLAEPLGQIPADTIAEVGHGDRLAGRRVLQKFIATVRRQRIAEAST